MSHDQVQRIRRLFLPFGTLGGEAGWQPSVDVYRTRDGWLIKADLAGVRPEDITVCVDGTRLTIRGVRRDWTLDEGCCHYRLEISYNHFERTIELPEPLERAEIATESRLGMLLVRIRNEASR
jgi:HSP20 family protein